MRGSFSWKHGWPCINLLLTHSGRMWHSGRAVHEHNFTKEGGFWLHLTQYIPICMLAEDQETQRATWWYALPTCSLVRSLRYLQQQWTDCWSCLVGRPDTGVKGSKCFCVFMQISCIRSRVLSTPQVKVGVGLVITTTHIPDWAYDLAESFDQVFSKYFDIMLHTPFQLKKALTSTTTQGGGAEMFCCGVKELHLDNTHTPCEQVNKRSVGSKVYNTPHDGLINATLVVWIIRTHLLSFRQHKSFDGTVRGCWVIASSLFRLCMCVLIFGLTWVLWWGSLLVYLCWLNIAHWCNERHAHGFYVECGHFTSDCGVCDTEEHLPRHVTHHVC